MDFRNLLFENIGIRQTIFKNTFWLIVAEAISRLLGFVLIICIARILGATEFGKFTFALAFISMFTIFSNFGLSHITTRELSQDKKTEKEYSSILSLKILLSIGVLILVIIGSVFITSDPVIRKVIWILSIYVLINNFFIIIYAFLRARQKMEYESLAKISQGLIILGVVFFVLFKFPSIENLSFGYLFANLIALILILLFFHFRIYPLSLGWNKAVWWKFLKFSWPLGLAFAMGGIYLTINSVMMGYWGQLAETGWYNAAHRIVGGLMIPSTLIFSSFLPVLSSTFKKSQEQARQIYNLYRKITIVIAVPLVMGGIVLASQIMLFLYGASYMPAILVFQILIAIAGVNFLSSPYSMMFVVSGRQKAILLINSVCAVLNIVLSLILIPRYSLYGAAVATLITYLVLLLITFELARQLIPFKLFYQGLFKTLIIVIVSSIIMLGVIIMPFISSLHILFVLAFGAAAYLAALFFFFNLKLKHWIKIKEHD